MNIYSIEVINLENKTEKKIMQEDYINGFKVIWRENIISDEERIRLNTDNIKKAIELIKSIPINKL